MIDHAPTWPIIAGLGIHCDVNSLPESYCPNHGNPHHEIWPVPPCVRPLLYMDAIPVQTLCFPLVPLNSVASCGVEGLWQGTKTYLTQLKDIFKTSHTILGNAAAPGIIYEVGTVPSAQSPVPSAKTWAPICLNQSWNLEASKSPLRYLLRSFYLGYHHWCRRKRFTQIFLQAFSTKDRWKLIFSVTGLSGAFLLCCPEDMTYLKG